MRPLTVWTYAIGLILANGPWMQATPAQYANRYSQSSSSSSSAYELGGMSPSKRSGYAHSATALGKLSSEGYDDLADHKLNFAPGGSYRKPQDMAQIDANRAVISTLNTGELYCLDLNQATVSRLLAAPHRRWTKIAKLDDSHFAVLDVAEGATVVFALKEQQVEQKAVFHSPGYPHSLTWDSNSRTLFVSGQWSQRLYRFRADHGFESWQSLPILDLPIHGGAICFLPKHKSLVVVDAFGGDYVVLRDPLTPQLQIAHRSNLTGHNVPSIQHREDEQWLVFPFQLLNPETYSVQGDITWGGLLSNNIRWLKTDRLLTMQDEEVIKQGKFVPIGQVGNGAGDPSSLRFSSSDAFAVTLGGIDHVAVGKVGQTKLQQFSVGHHPIASLFRPVAQQQAPSANELSLYVLNEFSDSLTLVDLEKETTSQIALGPMRTLTLAERGERLFFHSALAHDGWMSCHSCHSHGHTTGQLNDNMSDGSLGSPKRILTLLGQADTVPYSWAGEIPNLEVQVLNSIQSTMATDFQISRTTVDAIAAYIRSLPAPPSIQAARGESQLANQSTGRKLFEQLSCNNCHAGGQFTSTEVFDVGLTDEVGQREFNPPSLVAVSQRGQSLLHDGRAKSLREVFEKYQHQLPRPLQPAELSLLVQYLEGL